MTGMLSAVLAQEGYTGPTTARPFPQRSPPWLLTTAAWGALKPAPESRLRGAIPSSSVQLRTLYIKVRSWRTVSNLSPPGHYSKSNKNRLKGDLWYYHRSGLSRSGDILWTSFKNDAPRTRLYILITTRTIWLNRNRISGLFFFEFDSL